MKLIVVHVTGLATEPIEELDGRTLLEAAQTDALDELARRGSAGTVRLLPEGTIAGAGAELLGLLDYLDDDAAPPSLGALEAMGVGVPLYPRDVAFRVNLSSLNDDGAITDTSGAGMEAPDALSLMALVDDKLSTHRLRFYPGRHFAHLMVWTDGPTGVRCLPAPEAVGRRMEEVMPEGDGDGPLRQLIWDSVDLLDGHRINHQRREEGLPPVNLMWPWAPGRMPEFRHFALKTGQKAVVLASRLEVLGAARAAGISTRQPTGTLAGARADLIAAARTDSPAHLHVDLAERFEHSDDPEAHVQAVTALDTELAGPLLEEVRNSAEAATFILLGTWAEKGWSERPPALWATLRPVSGAAGLDVFTEAACREQGRAMEEPGRLVRETVSAEG